MTEGDHPGHENVRAKLNGAVSGKSFCAHRLCHGCHEPQRARVSNSKAAGAGGHEREFGLVDSTLGRSTTELRVSQSRVMSSQCVAGVSCGYATQGMSLCARKPVGGIMEQACVRYQ